MHLPTMQCQQAPIDTAIAVSTGTYRHCHELTQWYVDENEFEDDLGLEMKMTPNSRYGIEPSMSPHTNSSDQEGLTISLYVMDLGKMETLVNFFGEMKIRSSKMGSPNGFARDGVSKGVRRAIWVLERKEKDVK